MNLTYTRAGVAFRAVSVFCWHYGTQKDTSVFASWLDEQSSARAAWERSVLFVVDYNPLMKNAEPGHMPRRDPVDVDTVLTSDQSWAVLKRYLAIYNGFGPNELWAFQMYTDSDPVAWHDWTESVQAVLADAQP